MYTNRLKQLESLKYWLKTSIKLIIPYIHIKQVHINLKINFYLCIYSSKSRIIFIYIFRSVYVDDSDDDFSDPTPARAQVVHVHCTDSTIIVALTSHNSFVCTYNIDFHYKLLL